MKANNQGVNGAPQQPPPPVQNGFGLGRRPDGHPFITLQQVTLSVIDAVDMMRQLKKAYPQEWQQIHMEIETPPRGMFLPEG